MNENRVYVKGNKLIIEVDISDAVVEAAMPSKSGKTKLVASSGPYNMVDEKRGIKVQYNVIKV